MVETQLQLGPSLIKQLGASDNKTRSRSLRSVLSSWLPSQSTLSDDDMKKLWKGLFYCFWHSDKLPAQTHLIDRLSSLLPVLDLPLSAHYFSVFLLTMRREWPGIDFLRLDKFYLLIRRFFRSLFLLLKKNSWNLELSNQFMGIVLERAFLADDKFQGNGVNYHIASVFLEELKPFLPLSKQVVQALVLPLVSVMGKAVDKVLLGKLKGNVFGELLKAGRALLELKKLGLDGDSENKDVVFLGTIALAMGFSAIFYEIGSSADCPQGNRKVLLGLHEEFLQLEKALALSGIEVSLPGVNNGSTDDDEVPTLVPIMDVEGRNGDASNGFGEKKSKKNKKRKKDSSDNDGKDKEEEKKNKKEEKKNKKEEKKNKKEEKKNKKKKKKKQENGGMDGENANGVVENGENSSKEKGSDVMTFDDAVIANLQMQFEKVAAEVGMDNDAGSPFELGEVKGNGHLPKKRKRSKSKKAVKQQSDNHESTDQGEEDAAVGAETGKSGDKSAAKKVRFAMKNNLVWKPHNPLPPESLRIPPSVTPRGSALKKGLSPGPIREIRSSGANKARKRAKSLKGRRGVVPPTIRRMKKSNSL